MKPTDPQPALETPPTDAGPAGLGPDQRLAVLKTLKGSGQTISLRTEGMSMRPLIGPDAVAEISFTPVSEVRPGDVILFHRREALVLHRVMALRREGEQVHLVEKGDHQPFFSAITDEQYLGVMTAVRTGNRRLHRDAMAGRMHAGFLLQLGRFEMFLYRVKVRIWGREPTRTGRFLNRALHGLRVAILRVLPGRGRKGGGA